MITRSKKNIPSALDVTTPLPSLSKKKDVKTPLSSMTKKNQRRKTPLKTETKKTTCVVEENGEQSGQNVQSPIFNIHVHIPAVPNDLNESNKIQPVFHLHLGDLVGRLTSSSIPQGIDPINKSFKVETMSELNMNSESQNSDRIVRHPSEKSIEHGMLNCKNLNEDGWNLGAEEPNAVVMANDTVEKNLETPKKSVRFKIKTPVKKNNELTNDLRSPKSKNVKHGTNSVRDNELPLRRSTRVANNVKLLQATEALRVNKKLNDSKQKNNSEEILNPFILKEPLIVLCDKCRVTEKVKKEDTVYGNVNPSNGEDVDSNVNARNKEDVTVSNVNARNKEDVTVSNVNQRNDEDCGNVIDESIEKISNGNSSCGTNKNLCDNEDTEMIEEKSSVVENDKQEVKNTSCFETSTNSEESESENDECLRENVKNSSSDESDESCTNTDDEKVDKVQNGEPSEDVAEKSEVKKTSSEESLLSLTRKSGGIYSSVYMSDNETSCEKSTLFREECNFLSNVNIYPTKKIKMKNGGGNIEVKSLALERDEHKIGTENDTPDLVSNNVEQHSCEKVNGDVPTEIAMDVNSERSSISGNLETNLDESSSDESHEMVIKEDVHQSPPEKELDCENANLKNENSSLLNIEEMKVLSKNSENCEELSVASPSFQLKLIHKELQKRNMKAINGKSKKFLKKKKLLQITKEKCESSKFTKKVKLLDKRTKSGSSDKKTSTETNVEQSSKDYIPLTAMGPTKFAVAQINCIKPSEHKAKNFKEAMLFGKRVQRFSDKNQLKINKLRKEARKKNEIKNW